MKGSIVLLFNFMGIFKEIFSLAGMMFNSKPKDFTELELYSMDYFPFKGYLLMMWCGCIIFRKDNEDRVKILIERNKVYIHHESIHLYQAQAYKTWFGYYLRYFWEWIKSLPGINSGAYYTIPNEVEAYANEDNLEYKTLGKLKKTKYDLKQRVRTYKENRKRWKYYIKTL